MRRVLLTLCVLMLAAPAAAAAKTETATSGNVTATFSYTGTGINTSNLRLAISRGGKTLYDQPVTASADQLGCPPCQPAFPAPAVHALDLESNGEPDVVLELYTGGAHCCVIVQVYSYDPGTNTYLKTEKNFGDPGATIGDLGHNHHFEFKSADDSFAYEFTSFAGSGLPIQLWRFGHRRFVNVTRRYPKLIGQDAAFWWREYERNIANGVGLIAAWAADEELLGHKKLVAGRLASERRSGHVTNQFIVHLNRFLRQHGYLR